MVEKIHLKPSSAGMRVHLDGERNKFLPHGGLLVDKTPYWVRRLRDGSVVVVVDSEAD